MFALIIFVFLALIFGYFATQNTQNITITLANNAVPNLPLYVVIGASLLVGLFFSWLINLLDSFSATMKIRGKEGTIKNANKSIQELTKQVNQLEIENAKLKGQVEKEQVDDESL